MTRWDLGENTVSATIDNVTETMIEMSHGAGGTVWDVLADLIQTADATGVPVQCDVNAVSCIVYPHTRPEDLVIAWRRAQANPPEGWPMVRRTVRVEPGLSPRDRVRVAFEGSAHVGR